MEVKLGFVIRPRRRHFPLPRWGSRDPSHAARLTLLCPESARDRHVPCRATPAPGGMLDGFGRQWRKWGGAFPLRPRLPGRTPTSVPTVCRRETPSCRRVSEPMLLVGEAAAARPWLCPASRTRDASRAKPPPAQLRGGRARGTETVGGPISGRRRGLPCGAPACAQAVNARVLVLELLNQFPAPSSLKCRGCHSSLGLIFSPYDSNEC